MNSLFKLINQFIQGYFCVQSKFLLVAVVSGGWLNHQAFEQFFCKKKQAICTVVRGPETKYKLVYNGFCVHFAIVYSYNMLTNLANMTQRFCDLALLDEPGLCVKILGACSCEWRMV